MLHGDVSAGCCGAQESLAETRQRLKHSLCNNTRTRAKSKTSPCRPCTRTYSEYNCVYDKYAWTHVEYCNATRIRYSTQVTARIRDLQMQINTCRARPHVKEVAPGVRDVLEADANTVCRDVM